MPFVDKISSPIAHVKNNYINEKIFPDSLKTARACPIPEVDNPVNVKDYGPVLILPTLDFFISNLGFCLELGFLNSEIETGTGVA